MKMYVQTQVIEVHPIIIADNVRRLADNIHYGELPRAGEFAQREYDRISAEVDLLTDQFEGDLVDRVCQLLEIIVDALTCPDSEYEARYYDLWSSAHQLDREIIHSYPHVTPRSVQD